VVSIYIGLLFIEGKKGHFGTVIIKVAYQLGLAKKNEFSRLYYYPLGSISGV
jgi:hypothetical protein